MQEKLEMYHYLAQKTHDVIMGSDIVNVEKLKQMAGFNGEYIIADLVNGQVVSREFDVFSIDGAELSNGVVIKPGDRIEVKTCVIQTKGQCKAYSLGGKEEHCDFVALVDMTNSNPDNIRISVIPCDVFFEEGQFTEVKGVPERFSWNGSYENKQAGSNRTINTNLFLEYEVK